MNGPVRVGPGLRLTKEEMILWNEPGTRGDAFRQAVRDRAAEQATESGNTVEILDPDEGILELRPKTDPCDP